LIRFTTRVTIISRSLELLSAIIRVSATKALSAIRLDFAGLLRPDAKDVGTRNDNENYCKAAMMPTPIAMRERISTVSLRSWPGGVQYLNS